MCQCNTCVSHFRRVLMVFREKWCCIGACKMSLKAMQQLCHCNKCANATHVPMQQMLHCNKCAIATPASSIYDSSQDLFMKYGVALAHVLQWRTCCIGTCVALAHWRMQFQIMWRATYIFLLQWYMCCNGTCVAMAHLLQWHICCIK